MPRTLHAPRRFSASYSLLGRWLQRHTGDERRAEAILIVVLTGLAIGLLVLHFAVWSLWGGALNGTARLVYAASLAAAAALVVLVGVVGRTPAITVTCTDTALHLRRGDATCTVPYDQIRAAELVSALAYHRHERRYAATRRFINRLDDEVLLLRTEDGPVALGLTAPDRRVLLRIVDVHRAPDVTMRASPAA